MVKKHHKSGTSPAQPVDSTPLFGPRSRRLMGWGGGAALLGFFCLALTDLSGSNWASWFSPLAILSGYFLISLGFFLPPEFPPPGSSPRFP